MSVQNFLAKVLGYSVHKKTSVKDIVEKGFTKGAVQWCTSP
jgi:hypothetical protein